MVNEASPFVLPEVPASINFILDDKSIDQVLPFIHKNITRVSQAPFLAPLPNKCLPADSTPPPASKN
ncbi:MAG: hypothetical protein AAFO94_20105, partial [Bacteroidota bacterium]